MSGLGLTFLRRGGQAHPTAGSDYILSENRGDPEVFRILMANGVSSDGVGITKDDAANITSIGLWFSKSTISSFDELRYFTSITSLVQYAFTDCSVQHIAIPDNVQSIGDFCFQRCTKLLRIDIGSGVTNIGAQALRTANKLQAVVCRAVIPPTIGTYCFYQYVANIYVPDASVDAYKTANNWSTYASKIQPLSSYTE